MEKTDLRIGNYVRILTQVSEYYSQIRSVHEKFVQLKDRLGYCDLIFVNGIKLEPHRLISMGFIERRNTYIISINKDLSDYLKVTIVSNNILISINEECLFDLKIKYVHQLQNIFYDLSGSELKYSQENVWPKEIHPICDHVQHIILTDGTNFKAFDTFNCDDICTRCGIHKSEIKKAPH